MENQHQRVLAHQLARVLTAAEYDAVTGAGTPTSTTITSGGNVCHDSDDSDGTVSKCK